MYTQALLPCSSGSMHQLGIRWPRRVRYGELAANAGSSRFLHNLRNCWMYTKGPTSLLQWIDASVAYPMVCYGELAANAGSSRFLALLPCSSGSMHQLRIRWSRRVCYGELAANAGSSRFLVSSEGQQRNGYAALKETEHEKSCLLLAFGSEMNGKTGMMRIS
ncbi:hypothetical protein CDAR_542301 [Caerostris darwini]|uniref:Uncharacterized protein n=1 Tax=Caerostris darwini TaxID=1538125 RepID=A0AAV4PEA9_9ARAC|nr:hypothetical protein CDAR_542301 [Caerostris darwini]